MFVESKIVIMVNETVIVLQISDEEKARKRKITGIIVYYEGLGFYYIDFRDL